jgi:hypothetical protein
MKRSYFVLSSPHPLKPCHNLVIVANSSSTDPLDLPDFACFGNGEGVHFEVGPLIQQPQIFLIEDVVKDNGWQRGSIV